MRVRFLSPAPKTKAQFGTGFRTLSRLIDVGFMPMPNYPKRGRLSLFPVPGCAEVPTDIYTLDLYCSGARGIWRGQTDGPGQPIRRLAMAGSARGGPGAVRGGTG